MFKIGFLLQMKPFIHEHVVHYDEMFHWDWVKMRATTVLVGEAERDLEGKHRI